MSYSDNAHYMINVLEYYYPEQNWQKLAFGLLGGIDIDYQCNLLRTRPIRMQIFTTRLHFSYLSNVLQLPYVLRGVETIENIEQEITGLEEEFSDVFLLSADGIFLVQGSEIWTFSKQTKKKSIPLASFHWKGDEQLYAVTGLEMLSPLELVMLSLADQVAYFQNAVGVEAKVTNWNNHIRRKSLRKSWPSLLQNPKHYFWIAQQLRSEIMKEGDVAYREKYIQFLYSISIALNIPKISEIALYFRRSSQHWTILAMSLLDASTSGLSSCDSPHELEGNLEVFLREDHDLDLQLRLELIEDSLKQILQIEREAFERLGQVLQKLQLGVFLAKESS